MNESRSLNRNRRGTVMGKGEQCELTSNYNPQHYSKVND